MLLEVSYWGPGGSLVQQMRLYYYTLLIIFSIQLLSAYVTADRDPYEVVGVRRDANIDQIKKAYKELARKLHPDKSNLSEDEAGQRFIELNKAFEILKDPERRSRFDRHGETEENRHTRGYHGHHNRHREYWNQNGFRATFTFQSSADSRLKRKSITTKQYYTDYVKESHSKLFFIFFYSDFCPSCNLIETAWMRIIDDLAKYNIGSFTINVYHEPRLSQDLGVNSIPHIACLIDGQVKPYQYSELSLATIVKFTKELLPNQLINPLRTESEQDRFISLSLEYNRLSAVIIHNEKNLKLRYLLIAYELRKYYRFGHISTASSDYHLLAKNYNLSIDPKSRQTHLLVFDENINKPVLNFNFNSDSFDTNQLKKQLIQWPFLKLPRMNSQQRFDDLCVHTIPKTGDELRTRLCVILLVPSTSSSLQSRAKLMEFIEQNKLARDERVVFSFIDYNKQSAFVTNLLEETRETFPFQTEEQVVDFAIIAIKRVPQDNRKACYKWIGSRWDPKQPNELDKAKLELHDLITRYKANPMIINQKLALSTLVDEEGAGLVDRVFWRFVDQMMRMIYYMTSKESYSTVTALIMCALVTSLFIYQSSARIEPSNIHSETREDAFKQRLSRNSNDELKILELKAETYNGMVRLLKPGYRSIIILTDRETKEKLLSSFERAVWPYRRNKSLLFGYLCLDKNLEWYRSLLEQVLGIDSLVMNKKNCIGTVLSLNGFKKYLRVYHAKHHEIDRYDNETDNDGSFLGFNEQEEEGGIENGLGDNLAGSNHATVYTVDNLLDRLPIWLDKMFDGLTKRYFIDGWPDNMK